MSRSHLKELGESLDAATAGLIVVRMTDMGARIEEAVRRADGLEKKERRQADAERDAKEVSDR